jgi:hypothetical protein
MLSTDSLVIKIIEVLEEQGIDPETYTVYDYIDPDALAGIIASADSSLEVRITIKEVQLSITQDGVHVLK